MILTKKAKELFADRLKELRRRDGITQRQLAEYLKLTDMAVSRYESGLASPSLDTFQKIAEFFHVAPAYLLGHDDGKQFYRELQDFDQTNQMFVNAFHDTNATDSFSLVIRNLGLLSDSELQTVRDFCNFLLTKNNSKSTPEK